MKPIPFMDRKNWAINDGSKLLLLLWKTYLHPAKSDRKPNCRR